MILDKDTLVSDIETLLRDNADQEISPKDLRDSLINIIDSVHVLSAEENIDANNIGTPADRNVRLGELALDSIDKPGRSASDTVAVGYKVLESNYDGIRNTGIGSFSMSCSIYGKENVSVGYGSMAGNVDGNYNVSVGNYGLYSNKHGRNNIAIGHGAGYFAPKGDSWKLYVGSYDIESEDVCEEISSGVQPSLMYGDLLDNQLGVGVVSLDDIGTLQVGGHITTSGNANDIGTSENPWRNIYISNSINDKFVINGNGLDPFSNGVQSLGSEDKRWIGKFTDISVTGTADIETVNYTNITDNTYDVRTIYLASSGNVPMGYLSDGQVEGGGLVLQSSGVDYRRDYHWTFNQPNYDLTCIGDVSEEIEDYARASWYSNISIEIDDGRHLRTTKVLGDENLALIKSNNCYGIFVRNVEEESFGGTPAQNEIQTVSLEATGGTYKLKYKNSPTHIGEESTTLNYNASVTEITQALESIPDIGSGIESNIIVTRISDTSYTVEFIESLSSQDIQLLEVVDVDLENIEGGDPAQIIVDSGQSVNGTTGDIYTYAEFDVYGDTGRFAINIFGLGWVDAEFYFDNVTLNSGGGPTGFYGINHDIPEINFTTAIATFIGNDQNITNFIATAEDHPGFRRYRISITQDEDTGITSAASYDLLDLDYETPVLPVPPSWSVVTTQEGLPYSPGTVYSVPTNDVIYVSKESVVTPEPLSPQGTLGNISNVNFVSDDDKYSVTYSMTDSDTEVSQKFRSRISTTKTPDHEDNLSHGFDIRYLDEDNEVDPYTQQEKDRLVVSNYDGTIEPLNAITLMKSAEGGLLGVTDIFDTDVLPETIVNVQSSGIADVRVTGATAASVQLLSGSNKLVDGAELRYILNTEEIKLSRYDDEEKSTCINIDVDNNVSFDGNETPEKISVHAGDSNAVVALQESDNVEHTSEWGKVYVKEFESGQQSQSLFFQDDEGNEFNLISNKFNQTGNNVYTDEYENTFVGDYSPEQRDIDPLNQRTSNTTVGYQSLNALTSGDENTTIGAKAGKNITVGDKNTLIGYNVGTAITNTSNSIVIGSNMNGENKDDQFLVGSNNSPYLSGEMGSYRSLTLHNGAFTVTSGDDHDRLSFSYDKINLTDLSQEFPDQKLSILFTGVDDEEELVSNTLWDFDHSTAPLAISPTYSGSNDVPYAELYGDLKLRGTLRFADGTYLDSAESLSLVAGHGINIETRDNSPHVDVDIDKQDAYTDEDISGNDLDDTFVLASHFTDHVKISLNTLKDLLYEADPRITACDGGFNHLFTNNSTLTDVCNSIIIGNEAGHTSSNWKYSTIIGTQAGYGSTIASGANSEHASVFLGYQAGRLSDGCHASVFIGSSAGKSADGSFGSIFIGGESGMDSSSSRSIGIGDNALEGVDGEKNIEITSGVGGHLTTRLIQGSQSNKMNIGDVVGSDMLQKRVSIGSARVEGIEATLEVRPITGSEKVQTWKNAAGNEVAYLDQDGNLHISGSVITF